MLNSRWLKKKSYIPKQGDKQQSWPDVAYWPSTQLVEKKQMLRVSRGFSCVNSGERVCGSDSPVSEELSTFAEMGEEKMVTQWDRRMDSEEMEKKKSTIFHKQAHGYNTVFWPQWFLTRFSMGTEISATSTLFQNPVG